MWCMFVCHHTPSFSSVCEALLQNCSVIPLFAFFRLASQSNNLFFYNILFSPLFPSIFIFFSFEKKDTKFFSYLVFYVWVDVCVWVYLPFNTWKSNFNLFVRKKNFWAMCQLCTLNIYRIAIYVIAWFSSTNIHALENCLISGLCWPLILCTTFTATLSVHVFFSSNKQLDLACAFTIYFCVLHHLTLFVFMLLSSFLVVAAFWLLFSAVQTNWLFDLAKDFAEFCTNQIFIFAFFLGPLLFV